ncbi:MAG: 4-oxalocrotonate decarboxylase [Eudoraea sp.]|nr:4-oxalocrotonate decarboxylase [Eudoraea sp.]
MKRALQDHALTLDQAASLAQATQQISMNEQFSLEEAYEIQKFSLLRRFKRGEKLTGYKLGFTSKAKMEQMGVHDLIWGRLTDQMQIDNGGTLTRTNFIHPRVEPEIAFLIGKRIDQAISLDNAVDYLDGVAGALEVIDSRYENFKFSLEDVIADNCSSAAYVVGRWFPPGTQVNDLSIRLKINGDEVQTGNSNAILDNPLASLVEITRILSQYGEVLEPGMIILAGAATPATHIHSGDLLEGSFEGLDKVTFDVG